MATQEYLDRKIDEYINTKRYQKNFLENNKNIFHLIRKATRATNTYVAKIKRRGLFSSTTRLTSAWIKKKEVKLSVEAMALINEISNKNVFPLQGDFQTDPTTQDQFIENIKNLNALYTIRLAEQQKRAQNPQEYIESTDADRDFILSYYRDERIRERVIEEPIGIIPEIPVRQVQKYEEKKIIDADSVEDLVEKARKRCDEKTGETKKKKKRTPHKGKDDDLEH